MVIINYRIYWLVCNKMQNSCSPECSQHLKRNMVKTTEVALIIVLAMAIEGIRNSAFKKNYLERNKIRRRTILPDMKYEYCVKIIMVCYLVWDSPPDYGDEEETDFTAQDVHNKYVSNQIDEDLRKAKCIPSNKTAKELRTYWENVQRWKKEVEKQFLSRDIFIVKDELDGGRAIKVNLWKVFKIQMTVICNRTKGADDYSIESNANIEHNLESDSVCDGNQEIAMWINKQIDTEKYIDDISNQFPSILAKIDVQRNQLCCPYGVLRDRIEVINDNIDTIMQLRTLDKYDRAESTGYALLDLKNLLQRLEYLNRLEVEGKQLNNCCDNWEASVEAVKFRFETDKNLLENVPSTNFTSKDISTSLDKLNQDFYYIQSRLFAIEKLNDEPVKENITDDCCSSQSLLSNIEVLINDFKLSDLKHHSPKDLLENVEATNNNINNSEMLFDTDQNQTNSLITKCSTLCVPITEIKNNLNSNLTHLEDQLQVITSNVKSQDAAYSKVDWMNLNKTVNDGFNKLAIMDEQLNEMLNNRNKSHLTNETPNIHEDKDLEHCFNTIEQKSNDAQKLKKMLDENMQSHKNIKINKETAIKELNDNINELIKKQQTQQLKHKGEQADAKRILEKLIKEISEVLDQKSQAILEQSQKIDELRTNITRKITEEKQVIKEINSADTEARKNIDNRIKELERKLNANKIPGFKDSIDNPLTLNKLDYLEARLNSMTNQSRNSVKHLLGTIDDLEARLKTVKDEISKSRESAKKCYEECDWGDLPSKESLQDRLTALEAKFENCS